MDEPNRILIRLDIPEGYDEGGEELAAIDALDLLNKAGWTGEYIPRGLTSEKRSD